MNELYKTIEDKLLSSKLKNKNKRFFYLEIEKESYTEKLSH